MNENKIIKANCLNRVKAPCGIRAKHIVGTNGIYEVIETYDQDGETIYEEKSKLIMSKEAFVEAYNTYIKGE